MKFIPLLIRLEFREFCLGLVLRHIDDTFRRIDTKSGTIQQDLIIGGEQHTRAEEYRASVDSSNHVDTERFLTSIRLVLSQSNISHENKDFLLAPCKKVRLLTVIKTCFLTKQSGLPH